MCLPGRKGSGFVYTGTSVIHMYIRLAEGSGVQRTKRGLAAFYGMGWLDGGKMRGAVYVSFTLSVSCFLCPNV